MPINSIVTNAGALTALQGLNTTNKLLDMTQKRVNTGFRVNDAKDDGASFAIAEGLRGNVKGFEAVSEQLSKAKGTVGVALEAMNRVSDTFQDIENVLVKLADDNVTGDQRAQYEDDYVALVNEAKRFIDNADFGGVNLLEEDTVTSVIANLDGTSTIDLSGLDLDADTGTNSIATFFATTTAGTLAEGDTAAPADAAAARDSLTTAANTGGATVASDVFAEAKTQVGDVLATLGQESRSLDNQISYVNVIKDAVDVGIGDIVDADLAAESAKLQSLQIRQQLATRTLSIANQAPSVLLGLFN
jgi:flagellin